MESKIKLIIKNDNVRKLKKFYSKKLLDPDYKFSGGRTGLHYACKYGSGYSISELLNNIGSNPLVLDDKMNFPLHYSIKYCLKFYSRSNVRNLVTIFLSGSDLNFLNHINSKGTSVRTLLKALNVKANLEESIVSESSSSSSESDEWESRLKEENDQEAYGRYDVYENLQNHERETFNQMADRIYSEYKRKKEPIKPMTPKKPELVLKCASIEIKDPLIKKYDGFIKLLTDSNCPFDLKMIPFTVDTTLEKIKKILLGNNSVWTKILIRKELVRWHPDKFFGIYGSRIKNPEELPVIRDIVNNVSRALLSIGSE